MSLLAVGAELGLQGVAKLCESQKNNEALQSLGKALEFGADVVGVVGGDPLAIAKAGISILEKLSDNSLVQSIEENVSSMKHALSHR